MSGEERGEDRWAIADVLQGYARRLDLFDVDAVGALFTDDATIDYGGHPEMRGGSELAEFLRERTAGNAWHQHLVSIVDVQLAGDDAATVAYFVSHAAANDDPDTVRQHVGEYRDRLRRTPQGWRIVERRQCTNWKESRRRTPG